MCIFVCTFLYNLNSKIMAKRCKTSKPTPKTKGKKFACGGKMKK